MAAFKKLVVKRLGEILVHNNMISREELKKALEFQKSEGGLLGEILVKLSYITERDIVKALTVQYGFPFLPLENYDLKKEMKNVLPENVARQYSMVPLDVFGNVLTVSMSNPLNEKAIEDVEMLTKTKVKVFISTLSGIAEALAALYGT